MPTAMHFFNRQYWHRLRLTLWIIHCWFLVHGLYWIFCWMERRKKPCNEKEEKCQWVWWFLARFRMRISNERTRGVKTYYCGRATPRRKRWRKRSEKIKTFTIFSNWHNIVRIDLMVKKFLPPERNGWLRFCFLFSLSPRFRWLMSLTQRSAPQKKKESLLVWAIACISTEEKNFIKENVTKYLKKEWMNWK